MCGYPKFAPKNETILFGGKFADEIFDEPSEELSQTNQLELEEVGKDFEQSYFAQLAELAENGNYHAIQIGLARQACLGLGPVQNKNL